MQRDQQKQFNELHAAGVFFDLFDQVVEEIKTQWAKAETPEAREELWQRARVVRDVRRAFNTQGGVDA